MPKIEDILNTKELAALPSVTTKVLDLLEDENADINEIVKIIKSDPSLTFKVIRIANSPIYASRMQIENIDQAVMMIGFKKLTNIILGLSIFSKFWMSTRKDAKELMYKFWWHSSSTGTIAKSISSKIRQDFKENEFIGGLLHQIGKLAMIQYDISMYKKVIDMIENTESSDIEAEELFYGFNHLEVGREISNKWKLPRELKVVISSYPYPAQNSEFKDLVASVNFAGLISERNGADFYAGLKNIDLSETESWIVLSESYKELKEIGIENIITDINGELKKAADFMNSLK